MSKKVLFIQPFQFVKKKLSNEILMWSVYLENYLKARFSNIITELIYLPSEYNIDSSLDALISKDSNNLHSVLDKAISKLDFNIDNRTLICISAPTSFEFLSVKLIAEYLQDNFPESIVIFGGYHASSSPDDFSYVNSPIDYVVVGEGEIALYKLLKDNIKKQKQPIIIEGSPVANLDNLPPLDLTLLDKYIDVLKTKARALAIPLSRGCPHSCSYCVEENLVKGKTIKRWRFYTPKRAVQETNTLVDYGLDQGIKYYGFLDSCFGYNKKWLNEFLELYNVDDNIIYHFVETRSDFLNEKLISKLQEKKMFNFYGVDSFSKKMLTIMNKTHNPKEYLNKFEEILKIHKEHQYPCNLGILSNHPGENDQSYQKTFGKIRRIAENDKSNLINFSLNFYHLFPRTYNYENRSLLREKYGTIAYFPEWWKHMKTLEWGAFILKPSSFLSFRESINKFTEFHIELDKIKFNHNKKGFGEFLFKASIIKKQRENLIKLLDENNIESDN